MPSRDALRSARPAQSTHKTIEQLNVQNGDNLNPQESIDSAQWVRENSTTMVRSITVENTWRINSRNVSQLTLNLRNQGGQRGIQKKMKFIFKKKLVPRIKLVLNKKIGSRIVLRFNGDNSIKQSSDLDTASVTADPSSSSSSSADKSIATSGDEFHSINNELKSVLRPIFDM